MYLTPNTHYRHRLKLSSKPGQFVTVSQVDLFPLSGRAASGERVNN